MLSGNPMDADFEEKEDVEIEAKIS